jgi:hypothetical protein
VAQVLAVSQAGRISLLLVQENLKGLWGVITSTSQCSTQGVLLQKPVETVARS